MEEQKDCCLSPEQAEMKIYENFIEEFGEEGCLVVLADAVSDLATASMANIIMNGLDDEGFGGEEMKAIFRKRIGEVQVACNLIELIIGDTAEAECEALNKLKNKINQAPEKE